LLFSIRKVGKTSFLTKLIRVLSEKRMNIIGNSYFVATLELFQNHLKISIQSGVR